MYKYQRTIKNSLEFSGIGLHTGKFTNIKLLPSKENEGIINENIDIIEDAISALSNLGYNKSECKKIVVNVYSNLSKGATLSELISISLKKLGNK